MNDRFTLKGGTLVERLESAVNLKMGGVWSRLSKASGVPQSNLQKIRDGSSPTLKTIQKICNGLGIHIEWLVDGRNNPDDDRSLDGVPDNHSKILINTDIKASAGYGFINEDDNWDEIIVHNNWFLEVAKTRPSENHRIVGVRGYSMDSIYKDGDLILIDISVQSFIGSGIYIFKLDENTLIKKIKQRLDGTIEVISANDEYSDYVLESSEQIKFKYLAKVMCAWKYEFT